MCKRKVSTSLVSLLALTLLALMSAACGDMTATAAPAAATAAATTAAGSTTAAASANLKGGPVALPTAQVTPLALDRKIIRNATISITTNDIEQTLTQLRTLIVTEGGLVFQENTSQQKDERPTATIVLQVPTQNYERVITSIRQAALKVTRQESTAQDVTEEYGDLNSQIVNLQRTEQGLQMLVDKAQKLEDVLALQRELTNVRGEIEKRLGRVNFLDKRSAFSTITVNLALPPLPAVEPPKPVVAETKGFDKSVGDAWDASLKILGTGLTIVVQIVVFFWWLLPGLLIGFVWWRLRRIAARKAEHSARQWQNT